MYERVEKSKENKSRSVASNVGHEKSCVKQCFGFVDNRAESATQRKLQSLLSNYSNNTDSLYFPKSFSQINDLSASRNVVQMVTYKDEEYSVALKNISTFRNIANNDLGSLSDELHPRDVNRDKKMLNIIAKSEKNIETKEQLKNIIDPEGKTYQTSIEEELTSVRPEVTKINDAATAAKAKTFLSDDNSFDKDAANLSEIAVNSEMIKIISSANNIKTIVQWGKINGIPKNATTINNTAKIITELFNPKGEITDKSKKAFPKKVSTIGTNSDNIIRTATAIEPELIQSGDEQYLRGGVGVKGDESGGDHLIIGKKLDTFKLEKNQEKSSGILKASVWTGSVNDAFIEGGIDGNKEFRLVSGVPSEIEKVLRAGNFENFIQLAAKWGQAEKIKSVDERDKPIDDMEPVWWAIWDTRKDDLTTLSKELVNLMKAGYVLV